jgi:hypothetical protein
MKLSIAVLGVFLLAAGSTAAYAQAPKARDAVKSCEGKKDEAACIKQVCSKAAKVANCEKNAHQQIEGPKKRAAAEAACKGKSGKDHLRCMSEHLKKK